MDVSLALGLGLLMTHEIDAGHHHEWRLLFWLRTMDDSRAQMIFTALHLPLFVGLLLVLPEAPDWLLLGIDAFLIVHAGLHRRLHDHAEHSMTSWFSQSLILGAAIAGLAHAVTLLIV